MVEFYSYEGGTDPTLDAISHSLLNVIKVGTSRIFGEPVKNVVVMVEFERLEGDAVSTGTIHAIDKDETVALLELCLARMKAAGPEQPGGIEIAIDL